MYCINILLYQFSIWRWFNISGFNSGKSSSSGFKKKTNSNGFLKSTGGNSNLNSQSSGGFGRGNKFGSGFKSRVR